MTPPFLLFALKMPSAMLVFLITTGAFSNVCYCRFWKVLCIILMLGFFESRLLALASPDISQLSAITTINTFEEYLPSLAGSYHIFQQFMQSIPTSSVLSTVFPLPCSPLTPLLPGTFSHPVSFDIACFSMKVKAILKAFAARSITMKL
jgi:hypothetical protein